ncbi:hypothetical protein C8A00DRAFT_30528 [Chaetomidium leptoderma]|uniref:Uncharacterized protein n=1 Tax=Chaetomidium leptoderma TaxID=669021 RepID=A0AAN6ZZI6_9PEZI|nr:hypothetical protein C8A00DRAFT_30528 [Chaetomidium leptoderma]
MAHPLTRPIDIYRLHVTDILAKITGCATSLVHGSLQCPAILEHGDLILPVPRLRLKGKPPNQQRVDFAAEFPDDHPLFKKPTPSGTHLPLFFTPVFLSQLILPYVFERQGSYGRNPDDPSCLQPSNNPTTPGPANRKEKKKGHHRVQLAQHRQEVPRRHTSAAPSSAPSSPNLYQSTGCWDRFRVRAGALAREPLKQSTCSTCMYARINAVFKPEQDASKKVRDEGRDTAEVESGGLYAERNTFLSEDGGW